MPSPPPPDDRATIAVHLSSDPLLGEFREPGGRTIPFRGWLGLATVIEEACAAWQAAPAPGCRPTPPDRHEPTPGHGRA